MILKRLNLNFVMTFTRQRRTAKKKNSITGKESKGDFTWSIQKLVKREISPRISISMVALKRPLQTLIIF